MAVTREWSITPDPYAYDEDEIAEAIASGFSSTGNNLVYASGFASTGTFKCVEVTGFSQTANRSVIIEESISQVAAASIYGGTFGVNGSFDGAFRGWDFATCGLLEGAMGAQTTEGGFATGEMNGGGRKNKAGVGFTLEMQAYPLAIKCVDEQATDTTGSNNVSGTTTVYRGVGITNFDLNLAVKDFAKASFQWIGRRAEAFDYAINTSGADATITGEPAIFYNAVLKWTPYTGGSYGTTETMKCKSFQMTLSRTMDQDYFFIGSEFLQGLYYNGLTNLGGSITLGAGDWQRIRTMMTGATTGGDNTLDQDNLEFIGTADAGTVLANAIPAGRFEVILHYPDGTYESAYIKCDMAKLTEMTSSAQGRNQFEKTVNWQGQINSTQTFTIEVYS